MKQPGPRGAFGPMMADELAVGDEVSSEGVGSLKMNPLDEAGLGREFSGSEAGHQRCVDAPLGGGIRRRDRRTLSHRRGAMDQ